MNNPAPFIGRHAATRERIWPGVRRFFAELPEPLHAIAERFLSRFASTTYPSASYEESLDRPALARITYLPLWHIDSYHRRGIRLEDRENLQACLFRSACFGFCAIRIWDDVIDEDEPAVENDELLLANLLQLESFRDLQRVFPQASPLWDYYTSYWTDYVRAVASERARDRSGLVVVDEKAIRCCGDKAALLKTFPVGVALYAGQDDEIVLLDELMNDFNQAVQLTNDLQSLRRDLEVRHYTSPIANAALAVGYCPGTHPSIDGLYGALVTSSAVLDTHDEARRLYERARDAAEQLEIEDLKDCLTWHLSLLEESEMRWQRAILSVHRGFGSRANSKGDRSWP